MASQQEIMVRAMADQVASARREATRMLINDYPDIVDRLVSNTPLGETESLILASIVSGLMGDEYMAAHDIERDEKGGE